jgi:hypothetical protein
MICRVMCNTNVTQHGILVTQFFLMVKGPAADATDAPQT